MATHQTATAVTTSAPKVIPEGAVRMFHTKTKFGVVVDWDRLGAVPAVTPFKTKMTFSLRPVEHKVIFGPEEKVYQRERPQRHSTAGSLYATGRPNRVCYNWNFPFQKYPSAILPKFGIMDVTGTYEVNTGLFSLDMPDFSKLKPINEKMVRGKAKASQAKQALEDEVARLRAKQGAEPASEAPAEGHIQPALRTADFKDLVMEVNRRAAASDQVNMHIDDDGRLRVTVTITY